MAARARPRRGAAGAPSAASAATVNIATDEGDLHVTQNGFDTNTSVDGDEYEGTRHNLGADVVNLLASRNDAPMRRGKERALVAEARIGGRLLALAFPQTYYNESGSSVLLLARAGLHNEAGWQAWLATLPPRVGEPDWKDTGWLARRHDLRVIEDCAQAWGARHRGRQLILFSVGHRAGGDQRPAPVGHRRDRLDPAPAR